MQDPEGNSDTTNRRGVKRKLTPAGPSSDVKCRKVASDGIVNAVAKLNAMNCNAVYTVESRTGLFHVPCFTISVDVNNGKKYVGSGGSKREAREAAASAALLDMETMPPAAVDVSAAPPASKNAVAVLNELNPSLVYGLQSVSGPPHAPVFTIYVTVSERKFYGTGCKKKLARQEAANAALEYIQQHSGDRQGSETKMDVDLGIGGPVKPDTECQPPAACAQNVKGKQKQATVDRLFAAFHEFRRNFLRELQREMGSTMLDEEMDVTPPSNNVGEIVQPSTSSSASPPTPMEQSPPEPANASNKPTEVQPPATTASNLGSAAVTMLYNKYTDIMCTCRDTGSAQRPEFTVTMTVNKSHNFEGIGTSKKMAKNAAAKAALATLANISFSPVQQVSNNGSLSKVVELPQTYADVIGKLVLEKFNELMANDKTYSRRKVLAGIVMTRGNDMGTGRVISLGTGTKCINGEHLSDIGRTLNDCHAEIIARRGLKRYLYTELTALCGQSDRPAAQNIFEKPPPGTWHYRLKADVQFHLYISTSPCGDARVFSPHENDPDRTTVRSPNSKRRGLLRTKIESGEGTIPVKNSERIQTWDGVLLGQRLRTMSCSDKVLRWNVLGLQGTLLASIIEPIYLESIVLGSMLHPKHMYRAVCGRLESTMLAPDAPFRVNKPKLALVTSEETRDQTKAPNFSVNWIADCSEVEVVNAFTGMVIENDHATNKMSRLAKYSLYERYEALVALTPACPARKIQATYQETKMNVMDYQHVKEDLYATLSRAQYGNWLKKPLEQDQFSLVKLPPEETAP